MCAQLPLQVRYDFDIYIRRQSIATYLTEITFRLRITNGSVSNGTNEINKEMKMKTDFDYKIVIWRSCGASVKAMEFWARAKRCERIDDKMISSGLEYSEALPGRVMNEGVFTKVLPAAACSGWLCLDRPDRTVWKHPAGTCDTCSATMPLDGSEIMQRSLTTTQSDDGFIVKLTGISKSTKYFPATRMCWRRGINSQSKQHIVSPVRNRVFRWAKWSLIFFKWLNNELFLFSSFLTSINFNLE